MTEKFKVFVVLLITIKSNILLAQVNPLKSQFFENSVLINPANAGANENGVAGFTFSSQWNKLDGSPKILAGVIHTPMNEKMGLGLVIGSDKAGLINRTSMLACYSYNVQVGDQSNLRFGLAAGFLSDKAVFSDAETPNKENDPALYKYDSEFGLQFKAGFGAAYFDNRITAQLSWINMNRTPATDLKTVDRSGITASFAYKLPFESGIVMEPLAGFREIKGMRSYWDVGVRTSLKQDIDLTVLYHTNKTFTAGVGYEYRSRLRLLFLYNTEPAEIRGVTGGTYEISVLTPFNLRKRRPN